MKYFLLSAFFLIFFGEHTILSNGVYLWEYHDFDKEKSCCLHLNGSDICNPQVSCTRSVYFDLKGIYDYISRLLNLEKINTFSHINLLNQAKFFIRHTMTSSIMNLSYRFDEQRAIKFLHEQIESSKQTEKTSKSSNASSSSVVGIASSFDKKEDIVWRHLVKLGIAKPWKRS